MKKNSPKRKPGSLHLCFSFLDHPNNCQITTNRSRQIKKTTKPKKPNKMKNSGEVSIDACTDTAQRIYFF